MRPSTPQNAIMTDTPDPQDEQGGNDESDTTTSTATRWAFTNDILAGILTVTLAGVVAAQLATDASIPTATWAPFATAALLAVVWVFGDRAVAALSNLRG
jgi:hypothetical protein